MAPEPTTSWHLVRNAAGGAAEAREEFARRYASVVRAYFAARWRSSPLRREIDDAVQDVFLDCFRADGALGRADAARPPRFRAYLYGVTRVVALRIERERAIRGRHVAVDGPFVETAPSPGESLAHVFDRAWSRALLQRAARLQDERADRPEARRRIELLRLRFEAGLPVREIAARWDVDPAWLHHQFATARDEFRRALEDVVRTEHGPSEAEGATARLLRHFSP